MRSSAFCPGHVSCVFEPMRSINDLSTGSRGFGIRLSLGSTATVEDRDDDTVRIYLDGSLSAAMITRMTVEMLAPGRGFDITIHSDLPISQGFGTSASGTIATAIAVADIVGESRTKAFEAAHIAEVKGDGGLGDVSAIVAGRDVPVRTRPGFPPIGTVENAGIKFNTLTVGVLGPKMETDSIIGDGNMVQRIRRAGGRSMERFLAEPTKDVLFEASNSFSMETGLESPLIRKAIMRLNEAGYGAGMCMLGNSIFTDASIDKVRSILGRGHVNAFSCSSSGKEIKLIRRA